MGNEGFLVTYSGVARNVAVSSYIPMFATQQELSAFVESILNPAVAAIHGFILSKDIPSLVAWNIKTISLIVLGIFNILYDQNSSRRRKWPGRNTNVRHGRTASAICRIGHSMLSHQCFNGTVDLATMLALTPGGGSFVISAVCRWRLPVCIAGRNNIPALQCQTNGK